MIEGAQVGGTEREAGFLQYGIGHFFHTCIAKQKHRIMIRHQCTQGRWIAGSGLRLVWCGVCRCTSSGGESKNEVMCTLGGSNG